MWNRFRVEAQVLAKLNHKCIVSVYNMGVHDGQFPYYVMDLLEGEGLDRLIKYRGPLAIDTAIEIFIQIADALSAAHLKEIIHRDIKPSNLMLLPDQSTSIATVKIVDFGIARMSKQDISRQSQTKAGAIIGTPFYMSPEQSQGLTVDTRSDIYSLGCTMFEALTGRVPFRGESAFQTMMLHQTETAPRLKDALPAKDFPAALELLVAKMLAKKPADRYQTMTQVKHDLERIRAGKTILDQERAASFAGGEDRLQRLNQAAVSRRQEYEARRLSEIDSDDKQSRNLLLPVLAVCLAGLILAGSMLIIHTVNKDKETKLPSVKIATEDSFLDQVSPEEREFLKVHDLGFLDQRDKSLQENYLKYRAKPDSATKPFKVGGASPYFEFPSDFTMASVRFDDQPAQLVSGRVPIPKNKRVCMYLYLLTSAWPDVLDKFGTEDLNGLEVITVFPDQVIKKISHWKNLDQLSFFNTLAKIPSTFPSLYEQSVLNHAVLKEIDQLPHLRSLGLCGKQLHGKDIAEMKLLRTISTLKLDGISNLSDVLATLPERDNLQELWLVNSHLTDDQLEPLTRIKNLKILRIRRSLLTPQSLPYFRRMHALKQLWRDFENGQRRKIATLSTGCLSANLKRHSIHPSGSPLRAKGVCLALGIDRVGGAN